MKNAPVTMNWLRNTVLLSCILALGGCTAATGGGSSAECTLPGDVDCSADPIGSSKEDAWNAANDPRRIANNLNYRFSELPLEGESESRPWAASYWPTVQGSTNYRWQGEDTLSPLEKYDAAEHGWQPPELYASEVPKDCGENAHELFTAYREALGPAARWQAGAQGRDRMFDGRDNDDDGEVDECGWDDHDGIESWWGLCHAWAPAAILEPEPLHAVEHNGQRFEVSDLKALLLTVYDGTVSTGVGGRCNDREVEHDDNGRVTSEECRDTNAGAWHVVVTNLIGIHKRAFVEDRTGGFEVWNQPLFGYQVTRHEEISLARAHELLETEGDTYAYNADAVKFIEVEMTTDWLTEGHQSTQPLGSDGYVRHDHYHYVLELDADGKIIGGEWVGSSRDQHPDFLWVPTGPRTGWSRRSNPNVDLETVRRLVALSRQPEGGDTPPPATGDTYDNTTVTDIPDDEPAGITSVVTVPDALNVGRIRVTVDITHTYRGDLVVELEHGGQRVTLHDQDGGSAEDLNLSVELADFEGGSGAGDWILHVSDRAAQDTGSLTRFAVTFLD